MERDDAAVEQLRQPVLEIDADGLLQVAAIHEDEPGLLFECGGRSMRRGHNRHNPSAHLRPREVGFEILEGSCVGVFERPFVGIDGKHHRQSRIADAGREPDRRFPLPRTDLDNGGAGRTEVGQAEQQFAFLVGEPAVDGCGRSARQLKSIGHHVI